VEYGGEKDVHSRSILGFSWRGRFERSEGDFLMIFGEGVSVQTAIMHNSSIKEPRTSQKDVTSIHGHNITPSLVLVVLPNG